MPRLLKRLGEKNILGRKKITNSGILRNRSFFRQGGAGGGTYRSRARNKNSIWGKQKGQGGGRPPQTPGGDAAPRGQRLGFQISGDTHPNPVKGWGPIAGPVH